MTSRYDLPSLRTQISCHLKAHNHVHSSTRASYQPAPITSKRYTRYVCGRRINQSRCSSPSKSHTPRQIAKGPQLKEVDMYPQKPKTHSILILLAPSNHKEDPTFPKSKRQDMYTPAQPPNLLNHRLFTLYLLKAPTISSRFHSTSKLPS